jgi:chromosome segregation ATPase
MELEDELDRMKIEMPNVPPSERRTSDYFSDSGASSTRFPVSDIDARLEQMETKLRKVEQEKAQVKIEMASRLQTELSRRRDLEEMVHKMEQQLQSKFEEDEEHGDLEDRVEELESILDDTRRLLSQEKEAKGSLEDLYNATRGELERHKNEHDNLRDEVVPQLKARLEGLEAEASDSQAIIYENTRMQQELAALKGNMHGRFGSIAEEHEGQPSPPLGSLRGLSRQGSLVRSQSKRGGSLTRSGSVKDRPEGARHRSGSLNGDAVKEIEDQRDALHKALKLLIIRSERQQRDHERAIKKLTKAKTKAEEYTPNRGAYHQEVAFLKEEVATLRKRTEDALEQKWEYEKGLSGLKMDLDRAELETRGLRIILQENDILAPSTRTQLSDGKSTNKSADDKIKLSISTAESERDQARQIAAQYRTRAQEVDGTRAVELTNSAKRMDELAQELDKQVQSNVQLRARLAEAVAKGEKEQRESNGRIAEMQKRLTIMEDSVLAAQQHSETTLGNHEAEVRRLEEASAPALQRLRISIPDGKKLAPGSPMLVKSPKLGSKKLSETSLLEMSRTQMLERKVKEMEGLLREAEEDMQQVVTRVNRSQLEVAELQTERDAAFSQMHKLQALIVAEREKAEALMP